MEDVKTMRSQTVDALKRSLAEAEGQRRELRFKTASHQLKQVRVLRDVKQTIARLNMVLSEKK